VSKRFDFSYWESDDGFELFKVWALDGLTVEQLARQIGCGKTTFNKWMKENPRIKEKFEEFKREADGKVVVSVYGGCFDRTVEVEKYHKVKKPLYDDDGKLVTDKAGNAVYVEELVARTDRQHVPADFRKQQFWLRNRKPKDWGESSADNTVEVVVKLPEGSGGLLG